MPEIEIRAYEPSDREAIRRNIDFLPEGRGKGLGRRILNQWFERLRSLGTPGFRTRDGRRMHLQWMTRSL